MNYFPDILSLSLSGDGEALDFLVISSLDNSQAVYFNPASRLHWVQGGNELSINLEICMM